jgi:NADH-quinone oxidoreductase subunit C
MSADPAAPAAAATPPLAGLSDAVARALPEGLIAVPNHAGELTFELPAARLLELASALRDAPELKFEMCMDVCGVDYLEHGCAEWKTQSATSSGFSRGVARRNLAADSAAFAAAESGLGNTPRDDGRRSDDPRSGTPRFAVVYHLLSITHNHRLRLRVYCPDDTQPMIDSVTGIWSSADWFERETFDLFGILFKGHPDLRRLLTDYGFIGHPFRKDFPLSGNVEVRYDPEKGRVVYQPVSIDPRVLVPKVIRHDNRYDPQLTNASVHTNSLEKPNG